MVAGHRKVVRFSLGLTVFIFPRQRSIESMESSSSSVEKAMTVTFARAPFIDSLALKSART